MTSNSLNIKKSVEKDILEWFLDNGVTEVIDGKPVDKTKALKQAPKPIPKLENTTQQTSAVLEPSSDKIIGTSQAIIDAKELARQAKTLEELKQAIMNFDGLSVKKTAMNMVFCDGNPQADIMVIGEAPGADEDRQGKPFVGASGQLLDKILGSIDLTRTAEEAKNATYISNIINWRPPGNRTPTTDEMKIALPFIERHIQLAQPKILILVGNTPMRTILNTKEGIKKMRGKWHKYETITTELPKLEQDIIAIPTFHPAFLLRNPYEKKSMWQDMIMIQEKRKELGII